MYIPLKKNTTKIFCGHFRGWVIVRLVKRDFEVLYRHLLATKTFSLKGIEKMFSGKK